MLIDADRIWEFVTRSFSVGDPGLVGRKTRRAHRPATRLNCLAPVLSRTVDVPPRCGCVTPRAANDFAHLDNLVGLAHARNGSKPARSNLKE
jgi:hypothetical protein